jgi:hypothetical protein
MKTNFGDKALRQAMLNDPLLREQWEETKPTRALDPVDHLIAKVGIGMVQTVEAYYRKYCEKPNEQNAKQYCLWRLRLHRRLNNDREILEAINEARDLGLFNEHPGKLCWDCDFG